MTFLRPTRIYNNNSYELKIKRFSYTRLAVGVGITIPPGLLQRVKSKRCPLKLKQYHIKYFDLKVHYTQNQSRYSYFTNGPRNTVQLN